MVKSVLQINQKNKSLIVETTFTLKFFAWNLNLLNLVCKLQRQIKKGIEI